MWNRATAAVLDATAQRESQAVRPPLPPLCRRRRHLASYRARADRPWAGLCHINVFNPLAGQIVERVRAAWAAPVCASFVAGLLLTAKHHLTSEGGSSSECLLLVLVCITCITSIICPSASWLTQPCRPGQRRAHPMHAPPMAQKRPHCSLAAAPPPQCAAAWWAGRFQLRSGPWWQGCVPAARC